MEAHTPSEEDIEEIASARPSNLLAESLVEGAAVCASTRADGWTPPRIHAFLHALAACGVVSDAARSVGMSTQSAYAFRNSARGRGFELAWQAALLLARRRLADELMSRAMNGCVDVIVRKGKVWGERHRYDNRLTMAVLARLDKENYSTHNASRRMAEEFDAFVLAVSNGNDSAVQFIRDREELSYGDFQEDEIIDRNETFARWKADFAGEKELQWQVSTSSTSDGGEGVIEASASRAHRAS